MISNNWYQSLTSIIWLKHPKRYDMANTNGMTFAEGHSSNRPPLFNGNHYTYLKNRMRIFIQALDYEAWKIIRDGPYIPTKIVNEIKVSKSEEEWDERDSRLIQLNAKAINML
jgi:hypothetical protein